MASEILSNKKLRILTGVLIGLFALFCLLCGGIPLFCFLLFVIFLGSKEFVKILHSKGFHASLSLIIVTNFVFALLIFFRRFDLMPAIISFALMLSFMVVLFKGRQPYIASVATTILGFLYTGWLPCHILLIRQIDAPRMNLFQININEGLGLVLFVFSIVVATDVGGYLFGRKFGKRKLAPIISPKKSIEGALGAVVLSLVLAACGVLYTELTIIEALFGGLLISASAQIGDLSESLLKRDAGVKDSSNILPGHGGILDRTDGFLFALPVAYYYFSNFTHGNNIIIEFFKYAKGAINVYFGM